MACPGTLAAEAVNCAAPLPLRIIIFFWAALLLLYLALFLFFNIRAGLRLRRLPYHLFRTGNVLQRWQVCCAAHL